MRTRRPYDPLALVPSPEAVRARLAEVQTEASKLTVLLEIADRVQSAKPGPAATAPPTPKETGSRA